ncbi:MAG: hypothetical protein WCL37_06770, partial [Chrysiogenales bacterium]
NYSIAAKQAEIAGLVKENGFLDFSAYVEKLDSIEEILVSFFTLLEMVKRHLLIALQESLFGTISLYPSESAEMSN